MKANAIRPFHFVRKILFITSVILMPWLKSIREIRSSCVNNENTRFYNDFNRGKADIEIIISLKRLDWLLKGDYLKLNSLNLQNHPTRLLPDLQHISLRCRTHPRKFHVRISRLDRRKPSLNSKPHQSELFWRRTVRMSSGQRFKTV